MYERGGLTGSGNSISQEMYQKKMEMTCIFEDPDQLNNYFRSSLKDLRPDLPMFESDQKRTNNYSQDRLNLRHCGKRVAATPDLPDGTFLDYAFLEKDVRGIRLDPNMNKYKDQQFARGKFIRHGIDDDNSVPSSGWNPTKVMKDIKGQYYNLKNRLKIFEESQYGRHNGGTQQVERNLQKNNYMQQHNDRKPIMRDETGYNRNNVVNDLSNNTSIGWKRTTDHRFQVAKYGQMRNNAKLDDQDWSKNRANARVEHDILLSWKDQTVSKALTLKMIDIAKKKSADIENGKNISFEEGLDSQVRSVKLTPADLCGIQAHDSKMSQDDAAHTMLYGDQVSHRKGSHIIHNPDSNLMAKTVIDPFILDFMSSINRKMSPREIDDLRNQIIQSDEYHGILIRQKNRKCNQKIKNNNELLWNSVANFEKGTSMNIANYSRLTKIRNANKNEYDYENYKTSQKISTQKKRLLTNDMYMPDAVKYDNAYGDERTGTKLCGALGAKYMNNFHEREDIEYNNLDEIISKN